MATSLQLSADASFSSSFLQKLTSLVQSIHPDSFQVKLSPAEGQAFRSCAVSQGTRLASTRSKALRPKPTVVPRLSLEVCRNELDELSEELDKEIEAVMDSWERWDAGGAVNSGTGRISTWDRGHPLDLNDEFIHEDPNYDEAQVNQEALQEYLNERGVSGAAAAAGKSASRNRNVELEKPTASTGGRPSGSGLRKPAVQKKPLVAQNARRQPQGAQDGSGSSSSDSPSEEEEDANLPSKRRSLGSVPGGGKARRAFSADRSGRLGFSRPKGLRLDPAVRRQSAPAQAKQGPARESREPRLAGMQGKLTTRKRKIRTDPSGDGSGTPGGRRYDLRRPNRSPGDASRREDGGDGDGLSSEADSEEEWAPDAERAALGEEEEGAEEEQAGDGNGEDGVEKAVAVRRTSAPVGTKTAARSYPCPECAREFSNSSNRRKHLRIHQKEFPFPCHACGKAYSDPSNLAKHQLSHGGERPHQCPHCPKAFFQKGHLHAHLRRHQGIRPFACLDCPSSFHSRPELAVHIKIHAFGRGEHRPRPLLRCADCDKTFAGQRLLRQHQRRHRSFPCEVCGLVFTLKFKWLFHKRSHESPEAGGAGAGPAGGAALPGIAGRRPESQDPGRAAGAALGAGKPSAESLGRLPPSAPVPARSPLVASTSRPEQPRSCPRADRPSSRGRGLAPAGPLLTTLAGVRSPRPVGTSRRPHGTAVPSVPSQVVRLKLAGPVALVAPQGTVAPLLPQLAGDGTAARVVRMAGPGQKTVCGVGRSAGAVPVQLLPARAVPPASGSLAVRLPPKASPAGPAASYPASRSAGSFQGRLGSAPLSGSTPQGSVEHRVTVQNPSLPPGARLPGCRIVPSLSPRTCPLCHAKYLGTHRCQASCPMPASEAEAEVICLGSPPGRQPPSEAQGERGAVRHSLRQSRTKVAYADPGDGGESDLGEDSEDDWQPDESTSTAEEGEEEELPATSTKAAPLRFPPREPGASRRGRPRRERYLCPVCDKRFVHQRSLKQHMRLHFAFPCPRCAACFVRSEQLKWHLLTHAKGVGA